MSRDKRSVDELSIEELERILAIRKREERQKRLERMRNQGRVITSEAPTNIAPPVQRNVSPVFAQVEQRNDVVAEYAEPKFDDELSAKPSRREQYQNRVWQLFVNRLLVITEVAAVLGLIFIGAYLFSAIGTLEQETAEAQALADEQRRAGIPTIAPTPQLSWSDVVLPGGHTPPTSPDGGQFNFEEVPVAYRSIVQEQIVNPVIMRPPPTTETALRLIIPKLEVDQSIVQGVDWDALAQGIGQYPNGSDPTDNRGNVVLAGHNDIYGEVFRYLDQLEVGDIFQIQTQTKIITYTITGKEIVSPSAVHVMESQGRATATLISCYPYRVNTQRIIIFADRQENI